MSTDRISEVRIHELSAPIEEPFGWSLNWTSRRTAQLVEVRTDSGLVGWGDGTWGGARLVEHPELVLGRSPFEVEAIYDDLRTPKNYQTRRGDVSCGGLDTALWDLCGKIAGMPVHRLLGGTARERVRPYLTALYRKRWPDLAESLAEEAVGWKRAGFRAMKMKVGYGPETDAAIVRAVREAVGPEVALGVDANCAYTSGTALRLCAQFEPYNLMWFEEPLQAEDLDGYTRLQAQSRVPIAAGETGTLDRLIADYVHPRRVDVLQPEVQHIGLTGARRLSHLCWLHRIRLAPHNWGTAVRTAAILQWMAMTPPATEALRGDEQVFEFDQTESPFRDTVIREKLSPEEDGMLAVPGGPGLGVTVIEAEVERFRERLTVVR